MQDPSPSKSLITLKSGQQTSYLISSAVSSQTDLVTQGESHDNLNLPPVDKGFGAWSFCAASFVLEVLVYGFCYSYGILQDHYMSHPPFNQASPVALSAVGPVAIALQYVPSLPISCFFTRYPDYMRLVMCIGLSLSFISLLCSSFATEVWHLILLQGIIYGGSGGLIYVPVIKLLSDWFEEKRGLATGIIFAGAGVGGFVFPYILNTLLNKVGLPWTLRIWAIATTVLGGISILGIRPRTPIKKYESSKDRPDWLPPQLVWVKKPLFWHVSLAIFLQGVSYFPVSLYIATFTRELTNSLQATIVLSIFNSAAVGGQILLGHLTDRMSYTKIMFYSSFGSAISVFLLWGFVKHIAQVYIFAIVFGILSGGFSSTWSSAACEIAGRQTELIGLGISSGAIFKGMSAVIGPVVASVLLGAGHGTSMSGVFGRQGYGAVEIFAGSCCLAASAASLLVAYYSPAYESKKATGEKTGKDNVDDDRHFSGALDRTDEGEKGSPMGNMGDAAATVSTLVKVDAMSDPEKLSSVDHAVFGTRDVKNEEVVIEQHEIPDSKINEIPMPAYLLDLEPVFKEVILTLGDIHQADPDNENPHIHTAHTDAKLDTTTKSTNMVMSAPNC